MFNSAKQKIERANDHVADIERQFAEFVAQKPHQFGIQPDPLSSTFTVRVRFTQELPSNFASIIGDAIHNMRSALDVAVWELIGNDHGTQDRYLKFPTGNNRINFESSCKGIKTPSQWVKDAIIATESFPSGRGEDIYHLNQLDNSDKHVEITPILRATTYPSFDIVGPDGTIKERVQKRNTCAPAASGVSIAAIMKIDPGFSVELHDDPECAPSIFFRHPGGFITSPVISTLKRYRDTVVRTVAEFVAAAPS